MKQDLLVFHARTFGREFEAADARAIYDEYTAAEYEDEEDDGLGYYPDGSKRTLTDAQIKMFRHSEIHSLRLRRQRAQELAEADLAAEGESESEGEVEDETSETKIDPTTQGAGTVKPASVSSDGIEIPDAEDEEAEYARFLENERQEFAEAAEKQRGEDRRSRNQADRTVSTRRKVRELDALMQEDVVLDY